MSRELVFVVNTQEEYWRREFKAQIIYKDVNYKEILSGLISKGVVPIFQLDEDFEELQFLATLPKHSLIGWCHSDEKYDLKFNVKVASLGSLKLVLRPYKYSKGSLSNTLKSLGATFLNIKYLSNFSEYARLLMWQFRGLNMQVRQLTIRALFAVQRRNYRDIPIGYTNIFAKSIGTVMNLNRDSSILDSHQPLEISAEGFRATFTGQSGQVVREAAIRALEEIPGQQVTRRKSYGASNIMTSDVLNNGIDYVNNLLKHQLVLCPPGNISGESFRIFETISLRRLPIFMKHVTSDPNFGSNLEFQPSYSDKRNWGKVIDKYFNISKIEYLEYVSHNIHIIKSEIKALNDVLTSLV